VARVDVGGVALEVLAYVEGAMDGEGPEQRPLLLLHGFTGSAAGWWDVLPALGEGRVCFAPDLLGHGDSDAPDDPRPYAWKAALQQLVALLDRLGVEDVDVLGYSMGGRLALGLALHAPRRVRRLVLEGANPGIRAPQERAERLARDAALGDRIQKEGVEAFVDFWEQQPLFATQRALPAQARARLRAERLRHTPHGLAHALRGLSPGAVPPLWDKLAEYRRPTLLVAGALDLTYRAVLDEAAGRMAEGRRVDIPGAGHNAHLEQPDAFGAAVGAFLAD
jgi:2-succinyl-6-hydroxy-2,4-cyclohexadiene-1-carboxylate synthase